MLYRLLMPNLFFISYLQMKLHVSPKLENFMVLERFSILYLHVTNLYYTYKFIFMKNLDNPNIF
jgi:hypothetical protein